MKLSSTFLLTVMLLLCLNAVTTYPPSVGGYLRLSLLGDLGNELLEKPQIRRRFDSAALRYIGLGKRAANKRVFTRNDRIGLLNLNGRHLAVIGLGKR